MARPPLVFTFYIAAPIDKVWNGFVSKEANQTIFMGADFEVDLRPGGAMAWSGPGKDGTRTRYVTGEVLNVEAPTRLEYKFGMGDGAVAHAELVLEPCRCLHVQYLARHVGGALSILAWTRPGHHAAGPQVDVKVRAHEDGLVCLFRDESVPDLFDWGCNIESEDKRWSGHRSSRDGRARIQRLLKSRWSST